MVHLFLSKTTTDQAETRQAADTRMSPERKGERGRLREDKHGLSMAGWMRSRTFPAGWEGHLFPYLNCSIHSARHSTALLYQQDMQVNKLNSEHLMSAGNFQAFLSVFDNLFLGFYGCVSSHAGPGLYCWCATSGDARQ